MIKDFSFSAPLRLCGLILLFALTIFAQKIPAPVDVLGFTPGDDRKLASWAQTIDYFKKLDAASDRVKFEEIGKTTMGAPFVYATISSAANLKNLEKFKLINDKLADPRLIKSNEKLALSLIKQGKTIVLITCGIHSDEVGSYLSSMLIAHRLASSNDPEIQKILNETIILLVPSLNPDGVDIIKNWYDKTLGTPFEGTDPPELYHKYVGHDDNRDWYAFTQVETQLTVEKIHNIWHPQIVHDIHQQGETGSRLFLPPYLAPVEPNVPKEIVEGYTELGNFIAGDLRKKGFEGITTNSTYDAWTPARAYSHYHGGVRILSETASAKLATPVKIKFEDLRGGLGYDAKKESPNFSPVWKGGEWHLRDITNYMTTAAFSLLKHAAYNREKWLKRFYAIGKEAVRKRKDGEVHGFLLTSPRPENLVILVKILDRGGVTVRRIKKDYQWQDLEFYVALDQPYGNFAKALLERQTYPNLIDEKNNPIPPYDVTAHTISLLMNVDVNPINKTQDFTFDETELMLYGTPVMLCKKEFTYGIYDSHVPLIDEGWTRWTFEKFNYFIPTKSNCSEILNKLLPITDKQIQSDSLSATNAIIFPDQSPNQMLNGYAKGTMPDEYTGGIGKDGVKNLRKFVEDGGTLVFLNRASNFAIEQFDLPVKDVTQGLPRKDFYIPGSILRTELDTTNPTAKNMPKDSIAWFENSPAFEYEFKLSGNGIFMTVIASYPKDPKDILLSGWALGAEKIAGKAALVRINIGKGKIFLFGFRPQYRGQSLATFPLLFNAIGN
jgi:hypothetical protein